MSDEADIVTSAWEVKHNTVLQKSFGSVTANLQVFFILNMYKDFRDFQPNFTPREKEAKTKCV